MPWNDSEERRALTAFAEAHGVTLTTERLSREAYELAAGQREERPHHSRTYWRCTLARDGYSFSVPYTEGVSAWWDTRGTFGHWRKMPTSSISGEPMVGGSYCNGNHPIHQRDWPCEAVVRASLAIPVQKDAQPSPPTVADLLDCLASDASTYDNCRDFADWCNEFGYDEDSRTAERTYNAVAEQSRQLRRLLPADAYEALSNMERL